MRYVKTLVGLVGVVVPLIGLVPWWLSRREVGPFVWRGDLTQWLGAWLVGNGVGLAGWCVALLTGPGRGTPMPFAPPQRLIVRGPYRYVRNPMLLGVFLVLGGEVALFGAVGVWVYTLAFMGLGVLFVWLWEERDLERRFGRAYVDYKRRVPRWIPRPTIRPEARGGPLARRLPEESRGRPPTPTQRKPE